MTEVMLRVTRDCTQYTALDEDEDDLDEDKDGGDEDGDCHDDVGVSECSAIKTS